jgi:hypothetical protein
MVEAVPVIESALSASVSDCIPVVAKVTVNVAWPLTKVTLTGKAAPPEVAPLSELLSTAVPEKLCGPVALALAPTTIAWTVTAAPLGTPGGMRSTNCSCVIGGGRGVGMGAGLGAAATVTVSEPASEAALAPAVNVKVCDPVVANVTGN